MMLYLFIFYPMWAFVSDICNLSLVFKQELPSGVVCVCVCVCVGVSELQASIRIF